MPKVAGPTMFKALLGRETIHSMLERGGLGSFIACQRELGDAWKSDFLIHDFITATRLVCP